MRHLIRQRLLQRTLRHARIIQVAKTAAHTRRPFAPFPCYPALPGRKRREGILLLLRRSVLRLGLRLHGRGGRVGRLG